MNKDEADNLAFGDLYIDVRDHEKRVLTDCQVMFLPDIEATHIHFKEWQIRKRSSQRLIDYLKNKNKALSILEIGCGNGWLSSKLSAIENSKVTGLDINEFEIAQAKRVFKKSNIDFVSGDFNPEMFAEKFDIILFAASIQYFKSVSNILRDALSCLNNNGEIHIIDTNFYKHDEIQNAAQRTKNYYTEMGYPEMAAYYFHQSISDLQQFNYKVLLNPKSAFNRISNKDPFYWIRVNH